MVFNGQTFSLKHGYQMVDLNRKLVNHGKLKLYFELNSNAPITHSQKETRWNSIPSTDL